MWQQATSSRTSRDGRHAARAREVPRRARAALACAEGTAADADTWTTGTKQLVDAVAGLDTTCKSNDATTFETAFAKVHESFHGLLAASGAMPEGMEHGEMEHGEMEHGEMEHKM